MRHNLKPVGLLMALLSVAAITCTSATFPAVSPDTPSESEAIETVQEFLSYKTIGGINVMLMVLATSNTWIA